MTDRIGIGLFRRVGDGLELNPQYLWMTTIGWRIKNLI